MKVKTPSGKLYNLLLENRDELSAGLIYRVKAMSASYYNALPSEVLREQVEILVEDFTTSIETSPSAFTESVEKMVKRQISDGLTLHEVQVVLQMFEEMVWRLVVDQLLPEELVR